MKSTVAIVGAGPAGLTAAYLLSKNNVDVTVLEADPVYVGGISRTSTYKGFHFDIGGHRFFSKSRAVEDLWTEILPNDMLQRPRSSKIYYDSKFFTYPLKPFEALIKLGIVRSTVCVLSWLKARVFPVRHPRNFEEWVSNQFGKRLFNIFFKSYTEKVWGMSCKEISADWAAQRIRGLSLGSAIKNALLPQRSSNGDRTKVIKTLINSFRYPRKGPGMMWEACAEKVKMMGGKIEMAARVNGCAYDETRSTWAVQFKDRDGNQHSVEAEHVISSAPMRELVCGIRPEVSDGTVVRQKKAYPVYDDDYARHVATVRQELDTRYPNLHLVGRNGMHKYNNQDHAMMTAMLCVENILADAKLYDLWQVNADAEYHEQGDEVSDEKNGSGLRLVPARVDRAPELASEA